MANVATASEPALVRTQETKGRSALLTAAILLLIALATMSAVFGGPSLGDHETIVALCARNMRLSGEWVVPEFLGTPFFRKPPLPYWLIAGASYLLPDDPVTGQPVTATAARLPSAIAAFLTVLLLWRLAGSMFSRRVGRVTAVVAGSSLVCVLYGANATAEMLLAFCCTWAYVHFWYAVTTRRPAVRFVHAMLFYVAMGFGMLAKGPAPIALVAMPLALWWYTERPLRILSRQGRRGWRRAGAAFVRGLPTRTVQAFTRLWLVPGLLVFAAIFVPWMLAVAERHPHAWDLWNWQYWQRAQGDYEDTRDRGALYYVPIAIGLTAPWVFLLFEALAAPWLRRYARWHRPLLYAGIWAVAGVAVMSAMEFKKPYYIVPAIPGLLLLMGVVADRFYGAAERGQRLAPRQIGLGRRTIAIHDTRRLAWGIWMVLAIAGIGLLIGGGVWLHREMPTAAMRITLVAAGAAAGLLLAGAAFIRGRGWIALGGTAVTMVVAFHAVWYLAAGAIDAAGEMGKVAALNRALDAAGVPRDAGLFWVDRRPDSRLRFYFNRDSRYLVTPEEVVERMVDRTQQRKQLQWIVFERANAVLRGPEPVYLVLQQRHYRLVEESLPPATRRLAAVADEGHSGKGWVVITNAGPAASRD